MQFIGHRGASAQAPENTLQAVRLALSEGFGFEVALPPNISGVGRDTTGWAGMTGISPRARANEGMERAESILCGSVWSRQGALRCAVQLDAVGWDKKAPRQRRTDARHFRDTA